MDTYLYTRHKKDEINHVWKEQSYHLNICIISIGTQYVIWSLAKTKQSYALIFWTIHFTNLHRFRNSDLLLVHIIFSSLYMFGRLL